MKRNCWKIAVLLMLVVALLAGTMSACCSQTADAADAEFPVWTNPNIAELSVFPNDEYYTGDFQWAAEIMELEKAWDISTGSSTIRVGVIDSGVDITHPDLQYLYFVIRV